VLRIRPPEKMYCTDVLDALNESIESLRSNGFVAVECDTGPTIRRASLWPLVPVKH
jgi:hypothetical protein